MEDDAKWGPSGNGPSPYRNTSNRFDANADVRDPITPVTGLRQRNMGASGRYERGGNRGGFYPNLTPSDTPARNEMSAASIDPRFNNSFESRFSGNASFQRRGNELGASESFQRSEIMATNLDEIPLPKESLDDSFVSRENKTAHPLTTPTKTPRNQTPISPSETPILPTESLTGQYRLIDDKTDNMLNMRTIRVFGFPSRKAQSVLAEFQSIGDIVRRIEGRGNWIDIVCHKSVAQEALTRNGKEIINGLMIGVVEINKGGSYGHHTSYSTCRTGRKLRSFRSSKAPVERYKELQESGWEWEWVYLIFPCLKKPQSASDDPVQQGICGQILEYIFYW
mmetsp:Transcript_19931/g.48799  ORF Transcript_19931/g.48799 Transcript_19931/m.48799 type:complete len:338 (+) Transcript_19931:192-1205(+)|eukprot:CAMPEP_0114503682 /NCGR_PEP_ID=MMETSP0109-20121206/9784_1 /TAXON_ID=29199 /ORGANISM="Chlorarachnion reptans, Strain CCCM449" /LENGTH=337 /DNA_ID=CAMNT_0001681739 /DNA_START=159 /DNA_END=1172 /DNA_ORIENTATION=-